MKKNLLLFVFLSCITALFAQGTNPKPFVIPELQQWKGAKGNLMLAAQTTVVVSDPSNLRIAFIANQFASELSELIKSPVEVAAKSGKGVSIILSLGKIATNNAEGYTINISNKVEIKANQEVGLFWGTRTILQMLQGSSSQNLPKGSILDYPNYPLRGMMLDCGRKYFTIDFLQDYVKFMSYYKMNTFQIHLNDNGFKQYFDNDWNKTQSAFRLECDTYPGLTAKDGHYTKQEFIDLQILAENNYVNIIPEIDAPAHALAFTKYMPEIGSKEYGMDHLDLFNPKTYEFMDGLFKEYLEGSNPVFRGKYVHIGTDEYSNAKKEVVEKFRYFTDYYIKYVEKFGKKAVLWGALTHAKGETPVKIDDVLMLCWYNGYADPKIMKELGYDIVSIPDGLVYIVPAAGYYFDYLNTKHLYEKWTPATIGKEVFADNDPQVKGGMFAVWNDHPTNGIAARDVHHRVYPAMQTLSSKMWTGKNVTIPYDEFNAKRLLLTESVGMDLYGNYGNKKGLVASIDSLKANQKTGLKDVGFGYRVSFTLNSSANKNGMTLFESRDAKFFIRELQSGKLGFTRDGFVYTFNYIVPNGSSVEIAVEGDNTSTTLFVNGKQIDRLERSWVYYSQDDKDKMASVPTLYFPLERTGNFKGKITNLKVEKK